MYLEKGEHTFRLKVDVGGFNLNYFEAQPATISQVVQEEQELKLFQSDNHIRVKIPENYSRPVHVDLFDLSGRTYQPGFRQGAEYLKFSSRGLQTGLYIIRIYSNRAGTARFLL